VVAGGPDGSCMLYAAMGQDPSRIKIPKHGQGGAVFSNYDSNQKSDLIQVVLYVHNRVLFDRLKAWADGVLDPDSDETWVVSHTCPEGHNRCGNPAHLFLATNSVNQHQRQCPVPQSVPCPQCNYVQVCTCAQLLNPAMPNGVTLPCITPVARGIAPLALELQQGQARLQQALAQCTSYKHYFASTSIRTPDPTSNRQQSHNSAEYQAPPFSQWVAVSKVVYFDSITVHRNTLFHDVMQRTASNLASQREGRWQYSPIAGKSD